MLEETWRGEKKNNNFALRSRWSALLANAATHACASSLPPEDPFACARAACAHPHPINLEDNMHLEASQCKNRPDPVQEGGAGAKEK